MSNNDVIRMCVSRLQELDDVADPIQRHYALSAAYYDCKYAASGCDDFHSLWLSACNLHFGGAIV